MIYPPLPPAKILSLTFIDGVKIEHVGYTAEDMQKAMREAVELNDRDARCKTLDSNKPENSRE